MVDGGQPAHLTRGGALGGALRTSRCEKRWHFCSRIANRALSCFAMVSKSELRRRARNQVLGPDTGGIDPNEDKRREEEEARGDVKNSTA